MPKFFHDLFLSVSRKNFSISRKNFIYLPKFLTTFFSFSFFSHRLFSCFNILVFGSIRGAKIIKFTQIHNSTITVSAPEGGQTPLPTSMGGHGRICPGGRDLGSLVTKLILILPPSHTRPSLRLRLSESQNF